MINMFKMRKIGALVMCCCVSCILFYLGNTFYGFIGGISFMLLSMLPCVLLGTILLKNPFTDMLEGKGLLVLNFDSSGILRPFIVQFEAPYIKGNLFNKVIDDIFDRNTIINLAPVGKLKGTAFSESQMTAKNKREGVKIDTKKKKPYLTIEIKDEKEFNDARFGLYHYPVMIYNRQLDSLMTKSFLKNKEDSSFANHAILYANKKLQELSTDVKNFGRYVVENLKPKGNFLKSPWVIVVIVVFVIIMLVLFGPALFSTVGNAASAVSKARGGGAIVPK